MKKNEKNYTYILACADGSFYCGWTNDPEKRLKAHNSGTASKYTRTRTPVHFVYLETSPSKEEAMSREWHIKKLSRKEKEELIRSSGNLLTGMITGSEAKAADRYAIDRLGIPSLELMERASRYVSDHAAEIWKAACPGQEKAGKVLVLSSVGNNGADGVCAARQLMDLGYGPETEVWVLGRLEKASWEFLYQLAEYKKRGGKVCYLHPEDEALPETPEADIVIDALFGIGLKRPVEGVYSRVICAANEMDAYRIAVDVPSGINADDGKCMGICFNADTTLTFGRNKAGLMSPEGMDAAGRIIVCDIGIPEEAYAAVCAAG